MFERNILQYLNTWQHKMHRKPLIIQGARQVGKTVAVHMLAKKNFSNHIILNLEKEPHLSIFQRVMPMNELLALIQLKTGQKIIPGKTLLFIDEIQNAPVAMTQMRYFYEEIPQLHVIAAGSLLELKMKKEGFSFPVGRVEYCYMHPVTFDEFLKANHDNTSLDYLNAITIEKNIPDEMHHLLMRKYLDYLMIGGMPEAVAEYVRTKNFFDIENIHESILMGFKDDVYKYASMAKSRYIQHVIENSPKHAGKTITYEKFGESGFKSREMKDAFDVLEKAMVIHRVHISSSVNLPVMNNLRKAPKLLFLDSGLVNYAQQFKSQLIDFEHFNMSSKGPLTEQFVGQSLCARSILQEPQISTWRRDKSGTLSEVDFLINVNTNVIPIEVKSGKSGSLKSLHQFMKECPHDLGVRICTNNLIIEEINTIDSSYYLLTIPFYLLFRIDQLVSEYFIKRNSHE